MTWIALLHYGRLAWGWVRANAAWLALISLGAFTGAKLLKRKDSQVASLKDALEVEKHKAALEAFRVRREEVLGDAAEAAREDHALAQQTAVLDKAIQANKRAIAKLHDRTLRPETMTDAELDEYFRRAGL